MKTFVLSVFALTLVTLATRGQGSGVILRERAKGMANQNNAQQGAAPSAPQAMPAPAAPSNPALNATLQNIANLQANLAGLETNAAIKTQLVANLTAAA